MIPISRLSSFTSFALATKFGTQQTRLFPANAAAEMQSHGGLHFVLNSQTVPTLSSGDANVRIV